MLQTKKIFGGLFAASLLLCSTSIASAQDSDRETVIDQHKNPVVDSRGNCVRTTWHTSGDECAGAGDAKVLKEEKKVAVPSQARQLTKEQKVVYFGFDKDNLDAEAIRNLDNLARVLKDSSDVRSASIVGYADIIGSSSYNQKLSEKRAKNVRDYLAQKGYVNTNVAKVRALGKTDQFASCDKMKRAEKIECLRPNRRVELEIQFVE
jgi:OmpA-OmpF porin, OOP family